MTKLSEMLDALRRGDPRSVGRAITMIENDREGASALLEALDNEPSSESLIVGITGSPGSGKSTLTNQLISVYRRAGHRVGIVAVDPSSPKTSGSILGDRIRMMEHALDPEVMVRSMASRNRLGGLSAAASAAVHVMAFAGCQRILLETVGVGQTEMDVVAVADLTLLVMAPGLGDDIQAMKAGTLEIADLFVVNKADRPGADELASDMEALARDRGVQMCLTNAVVGTGVAELAKAIEGIDAKQRGAGEREQRRRRTREREILEWAVDLFRSRVLKRVRDLHDLKGDRRRIAQRLVDEMCSDR